MPKVPSASSLLSANSWIMSFKQFYLSERYDHDAIVRRQAADQAALPAGIHAANKAKRNAAFFEWFQIILNDILNFSYS